jgi:hypothetical protein
MANMEPTAIAAAAMVQVAALAMLSDTLTSAMWWSRLNQARRSTWKWRKLYGELNGIDKLTWHGGAGLTTAASR